MKLVNDVTRTIDLDAAREAKLSFEIRKKLGQLQEGESLWDCYRNVLEHKNALKVTPKTGRDEKGSLSRKRKSPLPD